MRNPILKYPALFAVVATLCFAMPVHAFFGRLLHKSPDKADGNTSLPEHTYALDHEGRRLYVHVPASLPAEGSRALVIVMHGGLGNAEHIMRQDAESALNMDAVADRYGFVVAYLNGTKVAGIFSDNRKGWNGGECCGLPSKNKVDDIGYITSAVAMLRQKYGISQSKVFATGHSNGAIMALLLACKTDLLAAAVPVSGALEIEADTCPAAKGMRLLALRGENDANVPYNGGKGSGISKADFRSQEYTRDVFTRSGADYQLVVLPDAAHKLDGIEKAIQKHYGVSFAEKAAQFFGLTVTR